MSIEAAFPARPLTMTSPFRRPSLWAAAAVLTIMLALGVFCATFLGGALATDTRVGGAYEPDAVGEIFIDGSCETKLVFSWCDVTLTALDGRSRQQDFLYVTTNYSDLEVVAGQAADGTLVLDVAQDTLLNRWLVFGVFMLFFIGGAWAYARQVGAERRGAVAAAGLREARLTPIEVVLDAPIVKRGVVEWRYRPRDGRSKTLLAAPETFAPLLIGREGDKPVALAVRSDAGAPVLVDEDLQILDLTDPERADLRSATAA